MGECAKGDLLGEEAVLEDLGVYLWEYGVDEREIAEQQAMLRYFGPISSHIDPTA